MAQVNQESEKTIEEIKLAKATKKGHNWIVGLTAAGLVLSCSYGILAGYNLSVNNKKPHSKIVDNYLDLEEQFRGIEYERVGAVSTLEQTRLAFSDTNFSDSTRNINLDNVSGLETISQDLMNLQCSIDSQYHERLSQVREQLRTLENNPEVSVYNKQANDIYNSTMSKLVTSLAGVGSSLIFGFFAACANVLYWGIRSSKLKQNSKEKKYENQ